jgi:lysophospholipase L1-like esterase
MIPPAIMVCMAMALTWTAALRAEPLAMVAFGDSTTAPRAGLVVYTQLLESELPARGIEVKVSNAGVPSSSTDDARKRFEKDVLTQNPTLVIIQFGINDSMVNVWMNPPATESSVPIREYADNLQYFVRALKQRNVKVILMTPNPLRWTPQLVGLYGKPPYQPESADGLNLLLKDYAEVVRQVARSEKVELVDVYAAFAAYGRERGKSVDGLLSDGMHPNNSGHRLIADLLIKQIMKQWCA